MSKRHSGPSERLRFDEPKCEQLGHRLVEKGERMDQACGLDEPQAFHRGHR
jgi:hypothetical protein